MLGFDIEKASGPIQRWHWFLESPTTLVGNIPLKGSKNQSYGLRFVQRPKLWEFPQNPPRSITCVRNSVRFLITLSYVDLTMNRLPVVVNHEFSRHNSQLAEFCHHRLGDSLGHGGSSAYWMVGSQALGQRRSA